MPSRPLLLYYDQQCIWNRFLFQLSVKRSWTWIVRYWTVASYTGIIWSECGIIFSTVSWRWLLRIARSSWPPPTTRPCRKSKVFPRTKNALPHEFSLSPHLGACFPFSYLAVYKSVSRILGSNQRLSYKTNIFFLIVNGCSRVGYTCINKLIIKLHWLWNQLFYIFV